MAWLLSSQKYYITFVVILCAFTVFGQTTVEITLASGQSAITNTSPIVFRAEFSLGVTGFDDEATDLNITANGTPVATIIPVSATEYDISITGMTDGDVVVTIPAGAATDTNTDPTEASTNTANTVTYDTTDPTVVTFDPLDEATNVSVSSNLDIDFNEVIVKGSGNIEIRRSSDDLLVQSIDVTSGSVTLQNGNQTLRINPSNFPSGQSLYVLVPSTAVVDEAGNNYAGVAVKTTWNFTTVIPAPTITNFTPGATCIGEQVTINGNNFGAATPSVTVNGTPATNIISATDNQIVFVVPVGSTTGKINVTNNDPGNGLNVNSVGDLAVKPAILLNLPVNPQASPINTGTGTNIIVGNTQNGVSYRMRRILPTTGSFSASQNGTGGNLQFATGNLNTPDTYVFEIEASSAGCTTATLTNTATVIVAALTANAGPDKNTCTGVPVAIGGSPTAFGGTGFHSVQWSGPGGFSSSLQNPTVTLAGTYTVLVTDDGGATDTDDVLVTVNAPASLSFVDTLRTQFTSQDNRYQLTNKVIITPATGSGVFSGTGVSLYPDGNYYFNPQAFSSTVLGVVITYTHTAANGCTSIITTNFNVFSQGAISGLDERYCTNGGISGNLIFNSASFTLPPGKSVSSFKLYQGYSTQIDVYNPADPNYPLTKISNFPVTYVFDPNKAWLLGGGIDRYWYILVYLKDNLTNIEDASYYTYGFTYVVAPGDVPDILPINTGEYLCATSAPIQLSSDLERIGYTTVDFNESVDNSIDGSGTGPYTFNPDEITFSGIDIKLVNITYEYLDLNGCTGSTTEQVNVVRKVEGPNADDAQYCQFFEGDRILTATSQYFLIFNYSWYETPALTPKLGAGRKFDTQINTQNPVTKNFYVTQDFFGCESNPTEVAIIITPAPVINLVIPPQCENRPYLYEGPTTNAVSWEWNFGDDTVKYTTKDIEHTYKSTGVYPLRLVVRSNTNGQICESSASIPVTVGPNPKPAFNTNFVCEGDATSLQASSDIAVDFFAWDFGDGDVLAAGPANSGVNAHGGRSSGTFKNVLHDFNGPAGDYQVELIAYTNLNCSDTIVKTVRILPYMTFGTGNNYLMEDLNGGDGFWSVDVNSSNSSWEFIAPNDTIIHSPDPVWVTNGDKNVRFGNYNSNEASAVNSPCLNISAFTRPLFAMDYLTNTQKGSDGAVLQVSTDGGQTWSVLGGINTGLNWYNEIALSGGNPGGQNQVAWSQADTVWREARHSLDIPILPPASRNKVRFRIAFASNGDRELEGFAFGNVRIEDRNRIMLVENFTTESDPDYASNNNNFKALNANETVKVQYHLNDPLNLQSPADQNARAAYYGITTSTIPRVYIDGYSNGNLTAPPLNSWYANTFNLRSLVYAPLEITASVVGDVSTNTITVDADLIANQDMETQDLRLHVAVVETEVGDNSYVIRKLLPDAVGRRLSVPQLLTGATYNSPPVTWPVNIAEIVTGNLAVVAFVQNEETKEILQASMVIGPGDFPRLNLITGVETPLSDRTLIYPVPANEFIHVVLPEAAAVRTPVALVDAVGKVAGTTYVEKGLRETMLYTSEYADGVYFISVQTDKGTIRKKIVVVHK